jgi:hypothetical protein
MKKTYSALNIALGLLALAVSIAPLTSRAEAGAKERKLTKAQEKYDADKDGKLSDEEKARRQADINARGKQTKEANLAKYDANKNGKLDDEEKARKQEDEQAAKAAEKEARRLAKAEETK